MADCLVTGIAQGIGADMHLYHSSQGDPIYAVGSLIWAGKPVPAQDALDAAHRLDRLAKKMRGLKNKQHARTTADELRTAVWADCPNAELEGLRGEKKRVRARRRRR